MEIVWGSEKMILLNAECGLRSNSRAFIEWEICRSKHNVDAARCYKCQTFENDGSIATAQSQAALSELEIKK